MKAVLYARCSSDMQAAKDLSIPAQIRELHEYAKKHGMMVVKEYIDEAMSGKTDDREMFLEMIDALACKKPIADAVLVWEFSRFARNKEDSIVHKALLRRHGVKVISATQDIDDSPSGWLTEGLLELLDDYFIRNLSKQTHRGQKENALRGFANGGTPPFGLRAVKIKDGSATRTKWEPDPDTAPIVKEIFEMSAAGMGTLKICKELNRRGIKTARGNLWGKNSLHSILTNERYTGKIIWNRSDGQHIGVKYKDRQEWIEVEKAFEPIITKDQFDTVRKKMKKRDYNRQPGKTFSSRYLLSGLIKCSGCGATYIADTAGSTKKKKMSYYICGTYRRKGREACQATRYNTEKLDRIVVDLVKNIILSDANIEAVRADLSNVAAKHAKERSEQEGAIRKKVEKLEVAEERYFKQFEDGKIEGDVLTTRITKIKKDKAPLQEHLATFKEQEDNDRSVQKIYQNLKKDLAFIREHFYSMRDKYLKPFMQDFIEEIIARDDELEVKYHPSSLLPSEIIKYSGFMDIAGGEGESSENPQTDKKAKPASCAPSKKRAMDIVGGERGI